MKIYFGSFGCHCNLVIAVTTIGIVINAVGVCFLIDNCCFVVVKDEVAVEMPVADINTIPNHIDDVFVDVVVAVAGV